ncbi:MAG: hypothetical protein ACRENE_24100 [Polyangiaceae bacterium]
MMGCSEQASKTDWPEPSNAQNGATNAPSSTGGGTTATQGGQGTPGNGGSSSTSGAGAPVAAADGGASASLGSPADASLAATDPGLPPGSSQIGGIEFLQRIAGVWGGINSNTPLGFDFPMTVEFSPTDPSFLFGKYLLDANDTVCWGFNIETYAGKTVVAFRNGGYLDGVLRDSRLQLVDHDTAGGKYHFCAVLEHGLPVDGCNYIDATYTFSAPDHMLFVVTTMSGKPHVHWDATRTQVVSLPNPFPASTASQGNGSAPWPPAAGIPGPDQ